MVQPMDITERRTDGLMEPLRLPIVAAVGEILPVRGCSRSFYTIRAPLRIGISASAVPGLGEPDLLQDKDVMNEGCNKTQPTQNSSGFRGVYRAIFSGACFLEGFPGSAKPRRRKSSGQSSKIL